MAWPERKPPAARATPTAAAEGAGTTAEASAGGGCFPAGTPVATAEGERPIETIQPGDLVLTADPDTGTQSYQRVTRTFIRSSDELFRIVLADGRSVEATGEHPFWVEGKGFVLARYLARSDLLRDEDGRRVPVARITSRTRRFTVYNFEVEPTHTYYAAGWWVHNQCPPRFGDQNKLTDHFNRHGSDFGAQDAAFYERQARHFLAEDLDPNALSKSRPNGDKVMYNPVTDEFGVISRTGTIRTYYKPDPARHGYPTNLDYFNAQ